MALSWDDSNMSTTQSQLAKAEAEDGGVRVDFGVVVPVEEGAASQVQLNRRFVLEPEAAANLLKLLNSLISEQNSTIG